MVTTIKLSNKTDYALVLSWLQENIGNLLHSQYNIFWHGEGWHMRMVVEIAPRGNIGNQSIVVEFDNPEHATWFGLTWL